MRLFSIGDIHGRFDLLKKLWDDLIVNYKLDLTVDKVIFTGDYCDRGPDTYSVICFLKNLVETYPGHVICLAGNHEWINIMYFVRRTPDDVNLFENNGGEQTLESYRYAGYSSMIHDHIKWMSELPFKHEEPGFFFSHAPVPIEGIRNIMNRGLAITDDELCWGVWNPLSSEDVNARVHPNGVVGVCGHLHALRRGIFAPRFYDHYIFGDAGCGCNAKAPLVAIEVKTRDTIYAWPDPVVK